MNDLVEQIERLDNSMVLGNSVQTWIVAFLIVTLGVLIGRLLKALLRQEPRRPSPRIDADRVTKPPSSAISPASRRPDPRLHS